jgi:hypothetical protein
MSAQIRKYQMDTKEIFVGTAAIPFGDVKQHA